MPTECLDIRTTAVLASYAMEIHTVESTPVTVRSGVLDPGAPAVAKIESGDVVSYPDTWTNWNNE